MISSLDNKKVKAWRKLHQKKYRDEAFILLDEELIKAAKDCGLLKTLVYVKERPFDFEDSEEVSQEVLDKIAQEEGLRYVGICNLIKEKKAYQKRVMILDHLQDPLNVGRIVEACYQFGFDSIIMSKESADIYHEKCLRIAKDYLFKVNIYHGDLITEIKDLKEKGFKVYATGLRNNSMELYDVRESEKMAFILGNEGNGVSEEVMNVADEIIKIDMCNIDSLNVAMAGAIIMYRFKL